MSCSPEPDEIFECEICKCQFEPGVAGVTADGRPRCPDCGAAMAHAITPEEAGEFVVMRWGSFG